MQELTIEDREKIAQLIKAEEHKPLTVLTPDGKQANAALDKAIEQQATPDKAEARRVRKRIRGIWRKWRTTALDAKALEVEKIACQIEIERAKAKQQLAIIRREEELAEAEHWLRLNKGNLEDIDANTTSKPNKFWYGLRRGFHHITKLTNNIPRIIKNLFWIGVFIIGLIILKNYNVL